MKKKVLFVCALVLMAGLAVGCKKSEDVKLDLASIEKDIAAIKGSNFDRFAATDLINTKVSDLEEVYDFDFKKTFGITVDTESIEEYAVGYNKKTKESYMLIKPMSDKKEDVKKAIENYYTKNKIENVASKEIDEFLVYLAFEGSEDTLKEVEKCKASIYGGLLKVDKELLKAQFDIEESDVEEYLIMIPQMITSSSSYMVVKPASGKKDTVKEKLDKYFSDQEEMWKTYLQDQYELVKNRTFEEYGDYLIYIVSSDNELILKTIKG